MKSVFISGFLGKLIFLQMMEKPAFAFDGRNIVDPAKLHEAGFTVHGIGKPQEPEIF